MHVIFLCKRKRENVARVVFDEIMGGGILLLEGIVKEKKW